MFQILIGGNISGNTVLEDDFTTLDSRKWLLHPGGTKMPVCGSTGDALVFIEKASTRYVVTTDIVVNEDSFLQIDFAASCSVTDSCYGNDFLVNPAFLFLSCIGKFICFLVPLFIIMRTEKQKKAACFC